MEQKSTLIIEVNAKNAERNTQRLVIELRNLQNNSDRVSTSLSQTERQASQTSNAFRSLATQMAGIVTVGAAINRMDTYTGMINKLKLVTDSQDELNRALEDTKAIALSTASDWNATLDVYTKFQGLSERLNLSQEQVAKITDTVSKAISMSGQSAAASEAALLQFGQALNVGVLRGAELVSVMSQAPALAKAIAQGMGVAVGDLKKLGEEGALTAEVIRDALLKMGDSVSEEFNKTATTISGGMNNIKTVVLSTIGELDREFGASKNIVQGLTVAAENLKNVLGVLAVAGIGYATKTIIAQGIAIKANIDTTMAARAAKLADLQATATATAAESSRTGAIANLTRWQLEDAKATMARMSGMQRLSYQQNVVAVAEAKHTAAVAAHTAATNADTAAQNANNAARSRGAMIYSALGGGAGLLTIGVMAAATAYFTLSGNVDKSTKSLMENNESVEDAIAKYKELNQAQQANQIITEQKELKKLTEEREKAATALQNYALSTSSANGAITQSQKEVEKLYLQYKNGEITLDQLNKTTLQSTTIVERDKNKLIEKAAALDKAEKKYTEQNKLVKIFNDLLGNTADEAANATRAVDKLTEATEKYNDELAKRAYRAKFQQTLEQEYGFSKELSGAYADLQEAAGGAGARIDANSKINANAAVANEKSLEKLRKQQEDAIKAQEDADKKRLKAQEDADKKAEQLRKEAAQRTIDIQYELSSELDQMYKDLEKKGDDIMRSDMSSTQKNNYLRLASEKYNAAVDLINFENEYARNEHNYTEETKLRMSYNVQEQRIVDATVFNKKLRELELTALRERFDIELAELKHNQASRLLEAKKTYMSEADYILQKYKLESAEIDKVKDQKLRAELQLQKNIDLIRQGTTTSGDFLSGEGRADTRSNLQRLDGEYAERIERMRAGFEQIKEETIRQNGDLITIEREYQDAKEQLQKEYASKIAVARDQDFQSQLSIYDQMLSSTGAVFGQMTSIINEHKDENTKTYKTMFALNKALAIAQAIVNTEQGATAALALGPAGVALSKLIRVMGYTSVGIIASQAYAGPSGEGYKSGGYTGNGGVNEVAGVVHGQEYVLNAEATNRIGRGTLDAINSGRDVALGSNQPVIAETNVVLVDEREKLGDYLYTPDGKRSMIKFIQQHADEIGI